VTIKMLTKYAFGEATTAMRGAMLLLRPLLALCGGSSIYNELDSDLLPKNRSFALIGCVGTNCTGDITHEGAHRTGEEVLQRVYDFHVSFIQPSSRILAVVDDEQRLHHYSWQICRTGFDPPGCTWRQVAAGEYDDQLLKPAARHIAALNRPIVLAVCNEMMGKSFAAACGNASRYSTTCSDDYKTMFSRVRRIFTKAGADKNVVWSWNTFNRPAIQVQKSGKRVWGNQSWEQWFPGEDSVSWVGINAFNDPYDGNPSLVNASSIRELYANFYRWVASKRRVHPFFHAFGTAEQPGHPGFKKHFLEELPTLLGPTGVYSRVRAAALYCGEGYDIQTSGEAIAGAKVSANSAVFDAVGRANATAKSCCSRIPHPAPCCWEYKDRRGAAQKLVPQPARRAGGLRFGWWLGTPVGNPSSFPQSQFEATLVLLSAHSEFVDILMPFVGLTAQSDGHLASAAALADAAVNSWLLPLRARMNADTQMIPMLAFGSNATAHAVYNDSDLYVSEAISLLTRFGFSGYAIDYEPRECLTKDPLGPAPCPDEPHRLAKFIEKLASALHRKNATLSLCVDDRPYAHDFLKAPFYKMYVTAGVDKLLQMGSYHADLTPAPTAEQVIDASLAQVSGNQLGAGIATLQKYGYTTARLTQVLQYAQKRGVEEVDVFLLSGGRNHGGVQWNNGTGPPASWWPLMRPHLHGHG
jgi:hypothetical protein